MVVVCVGRVREPFADDSAHYERLLGRQTRLEMIELKEAGLDLSQAQRAMATEAEEILRRIPDRSYLCVLDRGGRQVPSPKLASFLEQRRSSSQDLCFVVGGPFGLAPEVKERADLVLSLGEMTLPHQLTRVVLLEQLFRAHKILLREAYHY